MNCIYEGPYTYHILAKVSAQQYIKIYPQHTVVFTAEP
jgi:hypothetical protein